MPYQLDAEIAEVLVELTKKVGTLPKPERGDWKMLRKIGNSMLTYWASIAQSYPDVRITNFSTNVKGGESIELRWYTKGDNSPGSAVIYAHGGGMILGDLDLFDPVISEYVNLTGVPFLSVKYRLAPEAKGKMLTEDTFAGFTWLIEHAAKLGVDTNRIAVMGDSGGGAPAAGVAIMARDGKIPLAQQILIYPMIDDRNIISDPIILPFLTWTYDNNFTGWNAVLGSELGSENVSPLAAPARLKDFSELAPAYIEVGELDIFRDENITYAQQLAKTGIPIELHVHPGAPHGYDRIAPNAKLTRRAINDRIRVIRSI
jgi:acetyl esterase/lipase